MNNIKVSFVGGGKRMYYCAEALGYKGAECAIYGIDNIPAGSNCTRCMSLGSCLSGTSALVLPVPLTKNGTDLALSDIPLRLCDIFEKIPKETMVFAGAVDEKVRALAKKSDINIFDYMQDEVLVEKNAYATAEGAIMLLMQNSESTLYGAKCLVSGYGRIGHYTAKLLGALGADVTVLARRSVSRVKAQSEGHCAISQEELLRNIRKYDFIINTVPAEIFTEREVSEMTSRQKYIELASAPYGTDRRICDKYNIEITDGSALPSRYCPVSAGRYIAEVLTSEFERSGLL